MKTRLILALAAAAAASCTPKLTPPPSLFPVTTAWRADLAGLIDAPLATDGTRLFVATREGTLRALALADGKELWNVASGPGHLAAASGMLVVRRDDGRVARLDPETGATLWQFESRVAGNAPALVDGDLIFVGGAGLQALLASDGRQVWAASDGGDVTGGPVVSGARLIVGEEDGTLRARDRATGGSLWTFKTTAPLRAPALPDEKGRLLLGTTDSRFLAVGADKGQRRWQWKVGADVAHGAVRLDDSVLFVSFEDVLYALDRRSGHMRWRAPLPSRPLSPPLLSGVVLIVACHDADIVGFDARSGRRLGGMTTAAEIRTAPLLLKDRLYVGLRDRSVVALALDQTPAKEEVVKPKGAGPGPGKQRQAGDRDKPAFP